MMGLLTVMVVSLHHSRAQDGQLSSSLLREEMYLLQNVSSKQEPMLLSKIRYQLISVWVWSNSQF